ncbi:MAG: DUF1731 domain-containing protein, partial [Acidobacteriaceae bacterium]|nr:DUF1731 domain-containing protein [Acidobacteriaceae bacterium]
CVTCISRHPLPAEWKTIPWSGHDLGSWTEAIDGADVVINLAGRSVNCRYTPTNEQEIKNSRLVTTSLIGQAIAQSPHPPPLWLNASTATIYRHSMDTPMDEITGELGGHEPGMPGTWAFSIDVAKSWEQTFFSAQTPGTRKVAMRSAMIMSPDKGGVFDRLLQLVRFGLGGTAGPGTQYVSWIHEVDFIRAVEFLIEHEELSAAVNICSPCPLPNRQFMRRLRHAWCTGYLGLPIPTWALSIGAILLRTETELILKSRRVVPTCLLKAGFDFHFPNWRGAAEDLVCRWRELQTEPE